MESVSGKSLVEILNECLKESNLETVSKGELRKKYLEKTGLTKLSREDKKLFSSAVNAAYLNFIVNKTTTTDIADETKIDEASDNEVKENDGDWKLTISSSSDDDITPMKMKEHVFNDQFTNGENIKETSGDQIKENGIHEKIVDQEKATDDQFGNGVNDIEMESSSDLDEKSLALHESNGKESPSASTLNRFKRQRGKRTLISSSEDETIHLKVEKRNKILKKAKRSSDVETESITKSEEKKNSFKKAMMESSDSEDEPLSVYQKKSSSLSGSLNSVTKSDESENECLSKFIKKQFNNLDDSDDELIMPSTKSTKGKTKFIDDSKNHSSDSEDEPHSKDRKYDSIRSDKNSNLLIKKKINSSKKFSRSIEISSGSEDECLAKYSKKINDSSDSEDEPLNKLSNKKMHNSNNSEKKPSKKNVEKKVKKSVKNPLSNSSKSKKEISKKKRFVDSDDDTSILSQKKEKYFDGKRDSLLYDSSEDEPLSNIKKAPNIFDSDDEAHISNLKKEKSSNEQKSSLLSDSSEDEPLSKVKNAANNSSDSDEDAILSNSKKEKSFNKQKNSLLCDSSEDEPLSNVKKQANNSSDSEDEPLNKLSTKKSEKKRKNSESGSSSFVDENEEQPSKKNKSYKKKEAYDSGKEKKRPSASENKIEHLKKYLRVAGIRISNYNKLFENCKTMKAKCEKMMSLLEKEGLKGRPTLEKCKKLRLKIETKREIAELDVSNILKEGGGRPKRSVCSDTTNCKQKLQKKSTPIKFSRLQGIVDSEESD